MFLSYRSLSHFQIKLLTPVKDRRCPVLLHGRSKKYNFEIQLCIALGFSCKAVITSHHQSHSGVFPLAETVHFDLQHRGAAQHHPVHSHLALRAALGITALPVTSPQRFQTCPTPPWAGHVQAPLQPNLFPTGVGETRSKDVESFCFLPRNTLLFLEPEVHQG